MDRKKKRKNASNGAGEDPWKPTKEEIDVANYLYRKLPSREARLSGMLVRVFQASEAMDLLLDSPWAKANPIDVQTKTTRPRLFSDPATVVKFMTTLLQKQMFRRAVRIKRTKIASSKRREDGKIKSSSKKQADDLSGEPRCDPETVTSTRSEKTTRSSKSTDSPSAPNKSPKLSKPMRIELSPDQEQFLITPPPPARPQEDALDTSNSDAIYVWVYEPPPGLFNWLAGFGVILAIIICCLFPIWPSPLRLGTYYLSIGAVGLFGLFMLVALLRLVIYATFLIGSLGHYGFWLFPNYFADCGVIDSFKPVYSVTRINPVSQSNANSGTAGDRKRRCKAAKGPIDGGTSAAANVKFVDEPQKSEVDAIPPAAVVTHSDCHSDSLPRWINGDVLVTDEESLLVNRKRDHLPCPSDSELLSRTTSPTPDEVST